MREGEARSGGPGPPDIPWVQGEGPALESWQVGGSSREGWAEGGWIRGRRGGVGCGEEWAGVGSVGGVGTATGRRVVGWPWVEARRPLGSPQARHLQSAGKSVLRPLFISSPWMERASSLRMERAFSPLMDTSSVTFQLVSSLIWETPPPTHSHHFFNPHLELEHRFHVGHSSANTHGLSQEVS